MKYRVLSIICIIAILISYFCSFNVYGATSDEYKTFTQTDPLWAENPYGAGTETISESGCAITSLCVLMAYANPDLRDSETWNPGIAAASFSFTGQAVYWNSPTNYDSTFTFITKDYQADKSFSSAEEAVLDALDNGYYVAVFSRNVTSAGHYSPVVGVEDNKPKLWDVGGNGLTWDDFNNSVINYVVVFESSLTSSKDTLSGSVGSEEGTTDEMKKRAEAMMPEWEALGKSEEDRYFLSEQEYITLMGRENLSQREQVILEDIEINIQNDKRSFSDWFSIATMFIGLFLMVYSILMFVCAIVDRINMWIEISLVGILSFGKCRLMDKQDEVHETSKGIFSISKKDGLVTMRQWVLRCLVVFAIGVFLLLRLPQLIISKLLFILGGL